MKAYGSKKCYAQEEDEINKGTRKKKTKAAGRRLLRTKARAEGKAECRNY